MLKAVDLAEYCRSYVYADHPVMPTTRIALGQCVGIAEASIVLDERVRANYPRVLVTNLGDDDAPLVSLVTVVTPARYSGKQNAPKRPTLLRRLWSALR
jgi:hypothetical protein